MASGSIDFDKLITLYEQKNSNYEKLIENINRLVTNIYEKTSQERLLDLSKETEKAFNFLDKKLKIKQQEISDIAQKLSNHLTSSLDNLFSNPDDFLSDIDKLDNEIVKLISKKNQLNSDELESLKKLIEATNEAKQETSSYLKTASKEQSEYNKRISEGITFIDDFTEHLNVRGKAFTKGISLIKEGANKTATALTKLIEPWAKADKQAMSYAKSMGMSQKNAEKFLTNTVSWAAKNDIGLLFNKSTDELIALQSKYSEVLGRNVQLTSEQKKDMLAIESFLGEDGMMDIANNLENFGMGLSDSSKFIKKTMDQATKSGIAASKLTKTIRENIKMAQNYTFKNGLDGLSNMAKKAIELKTEMSLVNGFIDKTSTVEGAITTGAQLQVLGGSYAVGSNPLSMLYDSLNDVEGAFDRVTEMAKGKVFYNNATGNFEMGAMDRYMMKQAATVMGVDPSKMIDVAFRQASLGRIEEQAKLNPEISRDAELMGLIKNIATWDNGKAVVNIDGQDKEVSAITKDDKTKLKAMQKTDSKNLQDMAISLRSLNSMVEGFQQEVHNEQAAISNKHALQLKNLFRNGTQMLDSAAKVNAYFNITNHLLSAIFGAIILTNGGIKTFKGLKNIVKKTPGTRVRIPGSTNPRPPRTPMPTGTSPAPKTPPTGGGKPGSGKPKGNFNKHSGKPRKPTRTLGQQQAANNAARTVTQTATQQTASTVAKGGKFLKWGGKLLKGAGGAATSGVLAGGISLGIDAITGDLKKDTGASIGRAAGSGIGAGIGTWAGAAIVGALTGGVGAPVGAAIGSMIGTLIGDGVTFGIQKWQKNTRSKFRNQIIENISKKANAKFTAEQAEMLFGEYSEGRLVGNYKKRQLKKLEAALADGVIDKNDNLNKGLLKKIRANDDFARMSDAGIEVKLARGGMLNGMPHSKGGMPILGSNISVEGGEYVINKQATQDNLPLLEKINSGRFSIKATKPLGEQMSVYRRTYNDNTSIPHNSKLDVNPISINLSGTIKLDAGNRQFDISNELLSNPQLISKLTEMISKQINILDNGSYNKNTFKQKFS